jgi:hypothetical protein
MKTITRLPKGTRFIPQSGYTRKNRIAKYFAVDATGNALGYGLLYVSNRKQARAQLLNELNSGIYN